jgi:hypothetical protein
MTRKRSRLMLLGVLTVVLSVTVGFVSGSAAEAKKKKKKSANVANVVNTTPRTIPDRAAGPGTTWGRLDTSFNVGKKFNGKKVGELALTFQTTGDSATASNDLEVAITAPNGYRLPGDWWDNSISGVQSVGPLTITTNSPFLTCNTATPPCADPFEVVNRPYAGTVGEPVFSWLRGLPMRGTWTVTVTDDTNGKVSTLNQVGLKITAA